MSNEIEAVTEGAKAVQEVAKTTGKALDAAQSGGAYLARMLGTVPEDVVGLLGGDLLRQYRIRNWHRISEKTFDKLDQRGVEQLQPLNAKVIVPLLEATSNEGNETLQDMWAELLANAMDPDHDVSLQRVYIDTLKQFEPIDVRILSAYLEAGGHQQQTPDYLAPGIGLRVTEVIVSAERLVSLGCLNNMSRDSFSVGAPETPYMVSALGLELSRACSSSPTP